MCLLALSFADSSIKTAARHIDVVDQTHAACRTDVGGDAEKEP